VFRLGSGRCCNGASFASCVPVIIARQQDQASAFKLDDFAFFLDGCLGCWRIQGDREPQGILAPRPCAEEVDTLF
jgi:hypothetical protein